MERNMSQSTALCQSGCGFYGNAATDGLCSKCYKDAVMRKQAVPASAPAASTPATVSDMSSSTSSPPLLPLMPPAASSLEAHLNTASPTVTPFPAVSAQLSPKSEVDGSGSDGSGSGIRNQDEGTGSTSNVVSASSATPSPMGSLKDGLQSSCATEAPHPTTDVRKKAKNRCSVCKVKLGVIGFPCRCGEIFCSVHRYANEHACSFDYREHGQEEIRKNNPQIVGEKIQKI